MVWEGDRGIVVLPSLEAVEQLAEKLVEQVALRVDGLVARASSGLVVVLSAGSCRRGCTDPDVAGRGDSVVLGASVPNTVSLAGGSSNRRGTRVRLECARI